MTAALWGLFGVGMMFGAVVVLAAALVSHAGTRATFATGYALGRVVAHVARAVAAAREAALGDIIAEIRAAELDAADPANKPESCKPCRVAAIEPENFDPTDRPEWDPETGDDIERGAARLREWQREHQREVLPMDEKRKAATEQLTGEVLAVTATLQTANSGATAGECLVAAAAVVQGAVALSRFDAVADIVNAGSEPPGPSIPRG